MLERVRWWDRGTVDYQTYLVSSCASNYERCANMSVYRELSTMAT